jgi:type II secretion system protein I
VNQQGMTLIEVMVATAILALVLLAVIAVASQSQRSSLHLMKRTEAGWVANNVAAEIRAGLHGLITPTGSFQGNYSLGDQSWYWQAKAHSEEERVIRLKISVHETESTPPRAETDTAIWSAL